MKNIVCGALLFLSGVSFAESEKSNNLRNPANPDMCNVRKQFTYDYEGSECIFWDEVMVGIRSLDPLTIRCAQLKVYCTNTPAPVRTYPPGVTFIEGSGESY